MSAWLIVLIIVLLALSGVPLFIIFGALAMYLFFYAGIDISAVIIELYRLTDMTPLVAIPLFTFAGYMLAESNAPKRLVNFAQAMFGWFPGGLAIVVLIVCAFFTAFTGASGVTIVALGGLLFPMLIKESYPEKFSLGLITASGSIGLLFPPSLPIIVYGMVAEVNIDKLFIAGIIPGVILVSALGIFSIRKGIQAKVPHIPFVWSNVFSTLKEAAWEIPLPFIIVIGIYGGFVTATEASAVTAFYVFIVEVFIYRDLKIFSDLPRVMKESMLLVGAIISILGVALGLTNYLIDEQVPQQLFEIVQIHISSPITFLLILNGFLIIVGMMMDIFSATFIVVPLILPIARAFNIDPIHLGIIFMTNLEIGYLTPPVGLNLFLSSLRFKQPMLQIIKSILVFLALEVTVLLIITYWPDLSLWLVRLSGTQ
ncbi:MAG: TRAP transporter large permease [Bacteroidetes bacterium]|nr:TRAP transporter large permease [Bacteroidota bacterium]